MSGKEEGDWIPDAELFTELLSTAELFTGVLSASFMHEHQYLNPKPSLPIYTVTTHETPFQPAKQHTIGLGDPGKDGMVWETLCRQEKWEYTTYTFWYEQGARRKGYTWRRTKTSWMKHLQEMELRV